MIRRRAYIVRERTKFRSFESKYTRDCLVVYNGMKRKEDEDSAGSSKKGLFMIDGGVNWLRSLNLEPISMYLSEAD
jgi:hypothetical protein